MTADQLRMLSAEERECLALSRFGEMLPRHVPDDWRAQIAQADFLCEAIYRYRACFSCGEYGLCAHREPDFEIALIEERNRRFLRAVGFAA